MTSCVRWRRAAQLFLRPVFFRSIFDRSVFGVCVFNKFATRSSRPVGKVRFSHCFHCEVLQPSLILSDGFSHLWTRSERVCCACLVTCCCCWWPVSGWFCRLFCVTHQDGRASGCWLAQAVGKAYGFNARTFWFYLWQVPQCLFQNLFAVVYLNCDLMSRNEKKLNILHCKIFCPDRIA